MFYNISFVDLAFATRVCLMDLWIYIPDGNWKTEHKRKNWNKMMFYMNFHLKDGIGVAFVAC